MYTVCPDSGSWAARVVAARGVVAFVVVVAFAVVALAVGVVFVGAAASGLDFASLGIRAAEDETVAFTGIEAADSSSCCAVVRIGTGVVDWAAAEGAADGEGAVMVAETVVDKPVRLLQAESIQHSSREAVMAAILFISNSFDSWIKVL